MPKAKKKKLKRPDEQAILIWLARPRAMIAKGIARGTNRTLTSWVRQLIDDAIEAKGKP